MTQAITPRRRAWVLLLWLAVVGAAVGQILRTQFTADLSAIRPAALASDKKGLSRASS